MQRALLAMLFLVGCGDDLDPCAGDGVQVCGAYVRDADGRALVMRGVNLAGAHKLAPYTDTFTRDDYARLHAWGFRTLRFLITWAAIEPAPGAYNEAYLDWVQERMGWAHDAGLTVVIDMHQDVYGEGFGFDGAPAWTCDAKYYDAFVPRDNWLLNFADANVLACYDGLWTSAELQGSFAAMWAHVATRLANEPAIIGFDILNEPHWGTYPVPMFERDRLQPFYLRVIDAVRAQAPWIVFAEPAASRNLGLATRLAPFEIEDVVYAPHMYDASAELDGEFSEANRDALLATGEDLAADATRLGIPLWIGEYGGRGRSPQIGAYMDAAYDAAAAQFASTMYWAYDKSDGGYGLLDVDGNEVTPLVDAVVRPYPARIAGDPLAWSYDEASRTLEVSWTPRGNAATVIVTPARVYPAGVNVACGGCEVTEGDGEVSLVGGSSATISPR